ncbi:Methyl esterase [Melia azedarach]|uniref:Methyl esterase n=1 Tax=Melia azedarach TaxID=155640 RepID=A0ACC1XJ41_MELAZ|nr:Methyl esterase [Melia azedarach]
MGNALGCVSSNEGAQKKASKFTLYSLPLFTSFNGRTSLLSSNSRNKNKRRERFDVDDQSIISQQALAAALLFHSHQRKAHIPVPFSRSTSVTYTSSGSKKHSFKRSSSARQRSNNDPFLIPHQLVNQELKVECLETSHFVLVHGGGFGAWCWYKTMTLLEECGFKVNSVDLTGSGVSSFDTNGITSLAQYVEPLINILNKLGNEEKVILVGHDFGGACISYVMELFPSKIAKAVFITAAMLTSGQSAIDIFSQQMDSNDLMQQAQIFLYANGNDNPPTSIDLDRTLLRDLLFHQSSAKDVALASVSMRPIPFAPVLEKLSLSDKNYGSIPRFYIKTLQDFAIPVTLQEAMINSNPPEQVFQIKGSDHAPFFSKPQALHRILVEISQIPPKQRA